MTDEKENILRKMMFVGREVYAGNYPKALCLVNEVLKGEIKDLENNYYAHQYRGEALFGLGRYSESIEEFNIAYNLLSDNIKTMKEARHSLMQTLRFRGLAYQKLKNYEKALIDFEQKYQLDPNKTSGLLEKGELYLEIGSLKEARIAVEEYISKLGKIPHKEFFVELGNEMLDKIINKEKMKTEGVNKIKLLVDLIDRGDNFKLCKSDIAKVKSQIAFRNEYGKYDEAIVFAKKLLDVDQIEKEDKSYILIELGEAYYHNKQYAKAIDTYLQAEKITHVEKRLYFHIYLWLARSYRDKGDFRRAKDYFKKVYEYSPSGLIGLDYLKVLKKLGDTEETNKFFNEFRNDAEKFEGPQKHRWISLEYIGSALHIMGRQDEALDVLRKATETDIKNFAGLYESAKILIEMNNFGEADNKLNLILEKTKEWPNKQYWEDKVRKLRKIINKNK